MQTELFGRMDVVQPAAAGEPRPRKRVRDVSKAQYGALRDTPGLLTSMQHAVLTAIAAIYNKRQEWPTRGEIARWMWAKKQIPRLDVSLIAPRLTELSRGTKKTPTGTYIGGGVLEVLPARLCHVHKTRQHPWRIREAGARFLMGS